MKKASRWTASRLVLSLAAGLGVVATGACGKGEGREQGERHAGEQQEETGGLSPFQLTNGIGPMTEEVHVGPVNPGLAAQGKALFEAKCSACHRMGEKYVGPALGEVTLRRTPTYIMNMVLNPDGMYTHHPVAKELLGQFMTQMPNLGLTQDQARQLLEYLRTQAPAKTGS
jgi:mono/diheme cytochrome c family protein